MPQHRAGLPLASGARADDKVALSREHRAAQTAELVGSIRSVAIHERDHVGLEPRCLGAHCAGPAVSPSAIDYAGTRRFSPRRRAVLAAAVRDEHLANALGQHLRDYRANTISLIPGWNDDRDTLERQRLQRSPQPWQGFGGASLISAERKSRYALPFQISARSCLDAFPSV